MKRNRYKEKGEILTGNQIINKNTGEVEEVSFLQKGKDEPEDKK